MVSKAIDINAPTIEKKLIPYSNGARDSIVAIADSASIGILSCFFIISEMIIIIIKAHVKSATINGAKLAYPKGVRSK